MGTDSKDPEDLAAKSHHWGDEMKFTAEEMPTFYSYNLGFFLPALYFLHRKMSF